MALCSVLAELGSAGPARGCVRSCGVSAAHAGTHPWLSLSSVGVTLARLALQRLSFMCVIQGGSSPAPFRGVVCAVIAASLLQMQLFCGARAGVSALDEPPYDPRTRVSAKRLTGNHSVQWSEIFVSGSLPVAGDAAWVVQQDCVVGSVWGFLWRGRWSDALGSQVM